MRGPMAPERIILSAADAVERPRPAREGPVTRQPGSDRTPGPDATDGSGPDGAPDAVGGALDVIDRSIGMYVAAAPDRPRDEQARGAGSAGRPERRSGRVSDRGRRSDAGRRSEPCRPGRSRHVRSWPARRRRPPQPHARPATHPAAGVGPADPHSARRAGAPRERLVRDSGVALLALATIGLVAVVLWPHGPTGEPEQSVFGVNRTVVTPGPTGEVDAATAEPTTGASGEPETAAPTSEATSPVVTHATAPAGQPTPRLPPGATPRPTSRLAPTPTPTHGCDPDPDDGCDPDADAPTPTPDTDARADADADSANPTPDADPDADPRRPTPTPTPTPDPTRVTVAASRLCYTAAAVSGRP